MNIKLILLALLVAGSVVLTWGYIHTIEKNKRLTKQIKAANVTIEKLDDRDAEEKIITSDEEIILKEIRDAPESDGNSIVDNAIDSIERLRRSRGN